MAEQKQTGVENIPESSEARQQDAPVSKVCCVVVILRGLGYFADLRTNQWVFCGPKNADLVCGLMGKMQLKLQLFC